MTYPTITVEVAFTTAPGAAPSWTDVSTYTEQSFETTRGRSFELDQFNAGTAKLSLDNKDRRFDPSYTSGTYYPNVKPMKELRIRATHNSVTYDLFRGFIDGWPQQWQKPGAAVIDVGATDAFKVFAARTMPVSAYHQTVIESLPETYYPLDETSGSVAHDYGNDYQDGDYPGGYPGTYYGNATDHSAATLVGSFDGGHAIELDAVDDYIKLHHAAGFITGAVGIEFWIKTSMVPSGVGSYIWYDYSGNFFVSMGLTGLIDITRGATIVTSTVAVNDGSAHHVLCYCATAETTLWIDGVNVSGSVPVSFPAVSNTGEPLIGYAVNAQKFTGTLDEIATYASTFAKDRLADRLAAARTPWTGDFSGERVQRILDAIEWETALCTIDTGITVLGNADVQGKSVLSLLQNIAQTEEGMLFMAPDGCVNFLSRHWKLTDTRATTVQVTFGDGASDLLCEPDLEFEYDDQTLINDAEVTRTGGVARQSIDTTSIDAYLRHTKSLSNLDNLDDTDSTAHAAWLTTTYAQPLLRIRKVTLRPSAHDSVAMWAACLGTQIGDRVKVRVTTPAGGMVSQEAHIEGVHHKVSDVDWETTFMLSPAQVTNDYWILGTSLLDTGTRLGF